MTRSLGAPTSRPLTLFDPVLHAPSGRSGRESSIWKPRVTHFEIQTSGHEQDEEDELRILVVGCSTWHRRLDNDADIMSAHPEHRFEKKRSLVDGSLQVVRLPHNANSDSNSKARIWHKSAGVHLSCVGRRPCPLLGGMDSLVGAEVRHVCARARWRKYVHAVGLVCTLATRLHTDLWAGRRHERLQQEIAQHQLQLLLIAQLNFISSRLY